MPRPTPPKPPATAGSAPANPVAAVGSESEKRLVAAAYQKAMSGQTLSREERACLRRYEKAREETLRWQYYASIPQKHWRQMSGRQAKVLHEQAARYGLPVAGPTIHLPHLARAVHDFLAENATKLAKEDDPLLAGGSSAALERYREERAALARLDRLQREGELLPRDQVREALGRVATILRGAGDALQRQFGPAAVDLLHEALDDARREIDRSFGDNPDEHPSQDAREPADVPDPG